MNHNADINGVPHHHAHSHFYDYIEEFHGLPEVYGIQSNHKTNMQKLRNQLINENELDNKLCLRNCFKLNRKEYVEFCLDRKCGGVDFMRAANILGYKK